MVCHPLLQWTTFCLEQTARRGIRLNSPAANPSENRHPPASPAHPPTPPFPLLRGSQPVENGETWNGLQRSEAHGYQGEGRKPFRALPTQLSVRTCCCLPAPPLLLQNPPGRGSQSAPEGGNLRARNLTKKNLC